MGGLACPPGGGACDDEAAFNLGERLEAMKHSAKRRQAETGDATSTSGARRGPPPRRRGTMGAQRKTKE